jgi:hypothetical protein
VRSGDGLWRLPRRDLPPARRAAGEGLRRTGARRHPARRGRAALRERLVAQRCLYGVDKNPFAVDLGKLSLWLATLARDHAFTFLDHSIRHGDSLVGLTREQIASFHWPYAGKNTISKSSPRGYIDWLLEAHPESHGNADLVAHFFRAAFERIRRRGALGFVTTKTISQGDTRWSGLRWICNHNGVIYSARRRLKWPGRAAVTVSVVHVAKGQVTAVMSLDDKPVERISAYLFHRGSSENPSSLSEGGNLSFQGCIVYGDGFQFDDSNADANTLGLLRVPRRLGRESWSRTTRA